MQQDSGMRFPREKVTHPLLVYYITVAAYIHSQHKGRLRWMLGVLLAALP